MKTKLILVVLLLLMVCSAGAYAIVFHVLPSMKVYQTGGTLQESLVTVESFDLIGGKKVNSVDIVLNNIDVVGHTVNVYLSLEDIAGNEIGVGSSVGNVVPVGITALSVSLTIKPQYADVVQTIVTVKEII